MMLILSDLQSLKMCFCVEGEWSYSGLPLTVHVLPWYCICQKPEIYFQKKKRNDEDEEGDVW